MHVRYTEEVVLAARRSDSPQAGYTRGLDGAVDLDPSLAMAAGDVYDAEFFPPAGGGAGWGEKSVTPVTLATGVAKGVATRFKFHAPAHHTGTRIVGVGGDHETRVMRAWIKLTVRPASDAEDAEAQWLPVKVTTHFGRLIGRT